MLDVTLFYGVIYLITNLINDKKYVGQSADCDCLIRWRRGHLARVRSGDKRPLYCAIRKYGRKAFKIEPIWYAVDQHSLNLMEEFYIYIYDTLVPLGYNLTTGGSYGKHHLETRKKLSEIRTAFLADLNNTAAMAAAVSAAWRDPDRRARGVTAALQGWANMSEEQRAAMRLQRSKEQSVYWSTLSEEDRVWRGAINAGKWTYERRVLHGALFGKNISSAWQDEEKRSNWQNNLKAGQLRRRLRESELGIRKMRVDKNCVYCGASFYNFAHIKCCSVSCSNKYRVLPGVSITQ